MTTLDLIRLHFLAVFLTGSVALMVLETLGFVVIEKRSLKKADMNLKPGIGRQ